MPLTQLQITQAKPREKLWKLKDGGSLFLWVFLDGAKRWRLAYRFDGKQRDLALGVFPEVGLKGAGDAREAAGSCWAPGIDPYQHRRLKKLTAAQERTNTFEIIAAELVEKKRREGKSVTTLKKLEWLLEKAKPDLGKRPVGELKASEVLAVLREVEGKGNHETANRLRSTIGEVFKAGCVHRPR